MSHPPAEDPWPHAPGVPPQNPYPPHYSAESGNYPPPTQTGRKAIVRRIDVSRLRNRIVRFIGPATPKPNNAPWWNVVAQRREKESWRKAEEARQRRIGLLIFGVFGVLALIGITVGTLSQDDSADPGSRQAALAAPLASSTTETDDEGVVAPLESPATPTPTSDEPVYYASCAAVAAAGAAPLGQSDRGYRVALDRDGDGQACEPNGDDNPKPATKKPTKAPTTAPTDDDDEDDGGGVDPRFPSCAKANKAGYGPYYRGEDPEYSWYRDRDKDGIVCE